MTAAHEDGILAALKPAPKDGLSGAELAKATGLWSEPLYIALARMEHDGRIRSEWVDDPCPGRRLYHLPGLSGDPRSGVLRCSATGAPNAQAPVRKKNQTFCANRYRASSQNADG
jgi:hypothetical protein